MLKNDEYLQNQIVQLIQKIAKIINSLFTGWAVSKQVESHVFLQNWSPEHMKCIIYVPA